MSDNVDDHIPSGQTDDQPVTFKVGEREYNVDSAITKITNQDQHISTIEEENANLKAKLEESLNLEKALQLLKQEPQDNSVTPSDQIVDPNQIGEIVKQQLSKTLEEKQEQERLQAAEKLARDTQQNTLTELNSMFGDDVDKVIKEYADSEGVRLEDVFSMTSNPIHSKILIRALKANPKAVSSNPGESSFRVPSVPDTGKNTSWHKGSSTDIMAELQRLKNSI